MTSWPPHYSIFKILDYIPGCWGGEGGEAGQSFSSSPSIQSGNPLHRSAILNRQPGYGKKCLGSEADTGFIRGGGGETKIGREYHAFISSQKKWVPVGRTWHRSSPHPESASAWDLFVRSLIIKRLYLFIIFFFLMSLVVSLILVPPLQTKSQKLSSDPSLKPNKEMERILFFGGWVISYYIRLIRNRKQ